MRTFIALELPEQFVEQTAAVARRYFAQIVKAAGGYAKPSSLRDGIMQAILPYFYLITR